MLRHTVYAYSRVEIGIKKINTLKTFVAGNHFSSVSTLTCLLAGSPVLTTSITRSPVGASPCNNRKVLR